jgi:general L-amino acid transport system permease protein
MLVYLTISLSISCHELVQRAHRAGGALNAMSDITLGTAVAAPPPEAGPARRPLSQIGLVGWLRANLFSSWINSAVTLSFSTSWCAGLRLRGVGRHQRGLVGAEQPDQVCRDLKGTGACWA